MLLCWMALQTQVVLLVLVLLQLVQVSVSARSVSGAVESIARQPEAVNDIRANMILTAALIEGAALFAIIVGFLAMVLINHLPKILTASNAQGRGCSYFKRLNRIRIIKILVMHPYLLPIWVVVLDAYIISDRVFYPRKICMACNCKRIKGKRTVYCGFTCYC